MRFLAKFWKWLSTETPPYGLTILLSLFAFGGSVGLERYLEGLEAYDNRVVELVRYTDEFVAISGELGNALTDRREIDSRTRAELAKNILRQISLLNELKTKANANTQRLINEYQDELERTKILSDETDRFEELQRYYQRMGNLRSSWRRLKADLES